MDPRELEQLIDRELRELPAPRAPRTLMPRVMEAARTGRVPRTAPVWPGVLAVAALVAAIAAVPLMLGPTLAFEWMAAVLDVVSGVAALMRVLWRALFEPIVTYAGVLLLLSAFFCAAIWKALRLVAMEGASQS
jgi:hypothetical protein